MTRSSTTALLMLAVMPSPMLAKEAVDTGAIETLVETLASPHPAPDDKNGEPRPINDAAQKKVRAARERLNEIGPAAFPVLLANAKDTRYSDTLQGGAANTNIDVGTTCFCIVWHQLQPQGILPIGSDGREERRELPRRPHYPLEHGLNDPAKAKAWWAERRNKTLRELQVEVLEFVVEHESKHPDDYSLAERRAMQKALAELKSSKSAIAERPRWDVP